VSFRQLSEQAPQQGKTVPFTLPLRAKNGPMVLHVEHLGDTNVAYYHEMISEIQRSGVMPAQRRRDLTPPAIHQALIDARKRKRETVIRHCVRSIENVWHDDGSEATHDDIPALIWALPDDVFDDVWKFAEDPSNFRDVVAFADPKEVAGK
jgi:hypothetical protein